MITKQEHEQAQNVIKQYESEQLDLLRVSGSSFRDDIYELACKVTEIVHGKDYDWVNDDDVAKTMSDAYTAIEKVVNYR